MINMLAKPFQVNISQISKYAYGKMCAGEEL